MFKKYPLTIVMFLAGICAIFTALSISHASNPSVSDQQAIVDQGPLATVEGLNMNCRGGDDVDPAVEEAKNNCFQSTLKL